MIQTIEELAEKRQKWVEANRENGFEVGLKRLLTDLYPDNAHFIYELLQNAEDAHAQEVRFILNEDRIEFEHNGERLFTIQDVEAITSIGFSTKLDDVTNIGKFGVGFKAVFAYTDSPEIESGEFRFRILDMVVPESDRVSESFLRDGKTRFILPFDNPKKPPTQAMREVETLLKALGATTLLFLTHIRKIEYLLPDSSLGYIERIDLGENRCEIRLQQPNELAPSSSWFMKFDKEVQVEDKEAENESPKVKSCFIAVAFGLSPVEAKTVAKEKKDSGAYASPEWELAPMEPGRVCIYFPADKETSNLRFHLHAPFASTVARDSVRDCAGNNLLRDHLADLLAESMSAVRDQGLLTVRALALLPNDKDNLPEFYQPFINRLVVEFQEKNLVPMKLGGHAAASGVFSSSRTLSDLINDDDMVTLLGDSYVAPIWASNPPQRNQREDGFLSMLDIEQWDDAELVKALGRLNKNALGQWMGSKDEKWHQILYEMLIDFINKAPKHPYTVAAERKGTIKRLALVRCSDDIYRKGSECFFPTDGIEHDEKFPRVAKGVYFANKEENKKLCEFLKTVGVREVDTQVEIEYLLSAKYAYESECPNRADHFSHMRRFIQFVEENPAESSLFRKAYLFMIDGEDDVEWMQPTGVYLDAPYVDTGLNTYYTLPQVQNDKHPLSSIYKKSGINPERIGEFTKLLGAQTEVPIEPTNVCDNPEWGHLSQCGGKRRTKITKEDYHIQGLADFLAEASIEKAALIWRTMKNSCSEDGCGYLRARFGRNGSSVTEANSKLVHDLRQAKWIPQKNGGKIDFFQPRDAVAEKLPEGFEFQTGWQWLKALEFGLGVKERREAEWREQERQTTAYKRKEEVAKDMGFETPEEAEGIAKLKNEYPEEFRQLEEKIVARKERPTFPTRQVANPERRQEHLGEQLSAAPDKQYEKRERSVRTTNDTIDPKTWLRNQYTNEADQMVCQICKEEMPFRKRDGTHYFEKKKVLPYLPKEHEAQYLALCPLCAAKYNEFIINDDDWAAELKKAIVGTEDCEIPISLGDQKTSIRFVETHYHDLKAIIESEE